MSQHTGRPTRPQAPPERVTLFWNGNPYWLLAALPGAATEYMGEPVGEYVLVEGRATTDGADAEVA